MPVYHSRHAQLLISKSDPRISCTSEHAGGCCRQQTWASGQDSRRASAGTAPSSRMAWRLAISRDRFCSAPAADPHAPHAGALHRWHSMRARMGKLGCSRNEGLHR